MKDKNILFGIGLGEDNKETINYTKIKSKAFINCEAYEDLYNIYKDHHKKCNIHHNIGNR